ncbi:MAG TPA: DUF3035 domain-containing protein [Alphaproteobacteria bacterium]|nr:DUF3035 domain-containing protein [Alphaproteobacteria bacterium]
MTDRFFVLTVAVVLAAALAGCSSLRNTFGIERGGPDEFTVVRHAPLTLPPDYNLRPPQPGVPRPQEDTSQTQARSAVVGSQSGLVFGSGLDFESSQSSGETALLARAGADQVDPAIRETLNQEGGFEAVDRSFLEGLIFWREPEPAGEVVDAAAEAERLKANAEQGLPVTAGETPVIKRRKKALLEGVF